jgi:hypothetical protein
MQVGGPEVESARAAITDLLAGPPEARADLPDKVLSSIKALSPEDAGPFLVEAAKAGRLSVIPLLDALLDEPRYAAQAAEALGFVRSEDVAPLLRKAERSKSKAVVKSARRALHRLKSQGIPVEEAVPSVPSEIALVGRRRILKSMLSHVDSRGSQYLSLLISAPLTGIEGIDLIGGDQQGITDFAAAGTTKRDYEEHLALAAEHHTTLVEAPSSYILFRAREFEAVNREKEIPLPSDYQIYRDLFKGEDYECPLIYQEMDVQAVRDDLSLPGKAKALFETDECGPWFIPEDRIEPFALQLIEAEESTLVLSGTAQEERTDRILKTAYDEIFTPEVRALYKRRLEENAYVFLKTSREELAGTALSCALQLAPDRSLAERIPFIDELIKRSIAVFVAVERKEPRVHRVGT